MIVEKYLVVAGPQRLLLVDHQNRYKIANNDAIVEKSVILIKFFRIDFLKSDFHDTIEL